MYASQPALVFDGTLPPMESDADLLRRLGRMSDAADAYRRALSLTTNDVERRFLLRRLAQQPTQ